MTKEGRPGLRRKQPDYTIGNNGVGSSNLHRRIPVTQEDKTDKDKESSIKDDEPGRSTHSRKKIRRIISDSSSTSSNSSNQRYQIFSFSSPENAQRERTPISIMGTELDPEIINEDFPPNSIFPLIDSTVDPHNHLDIDNINVDFPDFIFPEFDFNLDPHNHWIVWRVYSEQIHSTLEKHIDKFKGNYLSTMILGELFYAKINDDTVDYDPTVEFQAVQITKMHDVFLNEMNGEKRLTINAVVVKTADNLDLTATETRLVYAVDSLAELLKAVVKKDDYLVIFGHNSLVNGDTIALNSRHQQLVLIVIYRHDGIFSPEVEKDSDNVVISFNSNKFRHLFQQHEDDNEVVLRIQPRNVGRPVLAANLPVERSAEKVARFLGNSSNHTLSPPEVNDEQVVSSRQRESCSTSISIGDYHEEIYNCFDSFSSTPSPKINGTLPQPASKSNSQNSQCGDDVDSSSPGRQPLSEVNNSKNEGSQEKSSRKKKKTHTSTLRSVKEQTPEDSEEPDLDTENESTSSYSSSVDRLIVAALYTMPESQSEKVVNLSQELKKEGEQDAEHINSSTKLDSSTFTLTTHDDVVEQVNVSANPWVDLHPDTQLNFTQGSNQGHKITPEEESDETVSKVPSRVRDCRKEFGLKNCSILLKRVEIPKSTSTTSVTLNVKKGKSASHKNPRVQKKTGLKVSPQPVQKEEQRCLRRRK